MKTWQIFVPSLLGLALAGCHSDPELAYLRNDNFKKEQEIYRLRNRVEELQEAVESSAPARPGVLRAAPAEMPLESGPLNGPAITRPGPALVPAERANSEPETPIPGPLQISPGLEAPPGEVPETLRAPAGSGRSPQSPRPAGPSSSSSQWTPPDGHLSAGASALRDNAAVAQITLHPALTGGIGTSGRHGDEGLLVVVEPRDFAGNIVNASGSVSVALLDPALTGEQARLARWDFTAAETRGMVCAGPQPGIHLRLPWVSTPAHDRLKVFVRYTTGDGRKLQAERLIGVALAGPPLERPEVRADAVPAQSATRPQWSPLR